MSDTLLKLGGAWHYRLDKLIACSTFGEIWQATWLRTGASVAIKTINRQRMEAAPAALRPLWAESLRREIALLAASSHRHIVRPYQHGEIDGLPVLVLEQLHHSLADELKARGPCLPPAEAMAIVRQIASALAWLHQHGICHLDIKPQNILLTPPGPLQRIKLADFGMSQKLVDGIAEHRIPGSLGWLAPEQVFPARADGEGQSVYRSSPRTDMYALGLILFHLLTGKQTEFAETVARLLRLSPTSVREQRDFLETLARAGLSTKDRHALNEAGSASPAHRHTTLTTSGHETWVPLGADCTPRPEHAQASELTPATTTSLLAQLLAFSPEQRPASLADYSGRP